MCGLSEPPPIYHVLVNLSIESQQHLQDIKDHNETPKLQTGPARAAVFLSCWTSTRHVLFRTGHQNTQWSVRRRVDRVKCERRISPTLISQSQIGTDPRLSDVYT